ncbi:MAG: hypothetical protein KBA31_04395 [Alphaproteobacteria bacterium]|nr:hypothetical protein [Alphaproteobacteria bacterium]
MADGTNIDGEKFDQLHRQLLADPSLQFSFEHTKPPELPSWLEPLIEILKFLSPVLYYVFWAGVFAVVAIILYTIVTEVLRRLPQNTQQSAAPGETPVPVYRPAATRAHALLEEADRLAREGRYGEAVRVLLHRSIEDMEEAFPSTIVPSMTSREISFIEHLSEQGRATFVKIARAVEYSLFAGRPLSAAQYDDCRQAYQDFVFPAAPA